MTDWIRLLDGHNQSRDPGPIDGYVAMALNEAPVIADDLVLSTVSLEQRHDREDVVDAAAELEPLVAFFVAPHLDASDELAGQQIDNGDGQHEHRGHSHRDRQQDDEQRQRVNQVGGQRFG